jgi:hypothetical protein
LLEQDKINIKLQTKEMLKILFLLFLVSCSFGGDIPCQFYPNIPNYCQVLSDGSINILVSAENEEITVTGNPTNGFEGVKQIGFSSPNKLHFIPTRMFEIMMNLEYLKLNLQQ